MGNIEYLEVSSDLRTVKIPKSITNLGVEFDDGVKRLYFKIPSKYGEFDLSSFSPRINYFNAGNEGDIYIVDDKTTDGDFITFSWLVERFAFRFKGKVKFNICLRLFDEDRTVIKEFNTTPAMLPVLEGLEVEPSVIEDNPSVIEAILGRLSNLEKNDDGVGIDEDEVRSIVDEYMAEVDRGSGGGIQKSEAFSIQASDWIEDDTAENGYNLYFDIQDTEITADVTPWLVLDESAIDTAIRCGFCPTVITYTGYIRVKCTERPNSVITGTYHLFGAASSENGGGISDGEIASDEEVASMLDNIFGDETTE